MSTANRSESASASSRRSQKPKEGTSMNLEVLTRRIEELKAADPEAYKSLEVKEWYSLNEAVAISGYSRAWLYRQTKKLGRFKDRARLIKLTGEDGSIMSAWRLRADLVQEQYLKFRGDLQARREVLENPKAHYKGRRSVEAGMTVNELVGSLTEDELAELKKLLS